MHSDESELWFRSFDAVNNKKRIKILTILLHHSPRSANEIRIKISANKAVFNYNMSVLEKARLVRKIRSGSQYGITRDGKRILTKLGITNIEQDLGSAYTVISTRALKKLSSLEETAYGSEENWMTVLGAFDTWPYMDYSSEILTKLGSTVFTSRYNYRKIGKKIYQYACTPDPYVLMGKFLENMIDRSIRAVIIFSVSAGHYIEADWCFKKKKPTLGIAFVREAIPSDKYCEDLITENTHGYSWCACKKRGTSWNCLDKAMCPFKKQGISLNVIEYFLRSNNMFLAATSKISRIDHLLKDWLLDKLKDRLR